MSIKKIDNYRIRLNEILGVNGNTFIGYNNLSKQEVVIKVIPKNQIVKKYNRQIQSFKQEIRFLHKIRKNASYVVRYLNLLETSNHFYVILEFCKGGNLKKLLSEKKLSPTQSFKYIRHILKGFMELIKKGIIHGNLNPQNILFHNGLMRLADFGFASNQQIQSIYSQIKNTCYSAPEILQGKKHSEKSDIWSFGFVCYQIIYGCVPWKTGGIIKIYMQRLQHDELQFPAQPQISPKLKNLIIGCLQVNPSNRFQWQDIFSSELFSDQFSQILSINIKLGHILGNIRKSLYESNLDLQRFFQGKKLTNQSILNQDKFVQIIQTIDSSIQIQQINYLFNLFDSNNTKMIEFSQFKNALQNSDISLEFQPLRRKCKKKIDLAFQTKIINKQNILDMALQKIVYQIKAKKIYDLYDIFIENDKDLSGILDFRELKGLLKKIQPQLNDEECRVIYKKMDVNNDNQVSFKEFMKSMCSFTGSPYKQIK